MSRWSNSFLALIAALLAFGAAHLEIASGSDLKNPVRGDAGLFGSRDVGVPQRHVADDVNRTAKSDRIAGAIAGTSGPTVVFNVSGMKNTSIAMFAPLPQTSSQGTPARKSLMSTAACEPPVSALAEAARVTERGRCIT